MWHLIKKDVYVTGFHCLSPIKFGCGQHVPENSMNTLQYSICLWVLLTLVGLRFIPYVLDRDWK